MTYRVVVVVVPLTTERLATVLMAAAAVGLLGLVTRAAMAGLAVAAVGDIPALVAGMVVLAAAAVADLME